MKKITLAFIILFVLVVGGIFTLHTLYPPITVSTPVAETPVAEAPITAETPVVVETPVVPAPPVVETPVVTPPATPTFTLAEVATHNSTNDCYFVIQNKVYDVSSYDKKHPGGSSTITDNCGTEVTGLFASIHSNRAWDLLGSYYIGELK